MYRLRVRGAARVNARVTELLDARIQHTAAEFDALAERYKQTYGRFVDRKYHDSDETYETSSDWTSTPRWNMVLNFGVSENGTRAVRKPEKKYEPGSRGSGSRT